MYIRAYALFGTVVIGFASSSFACSSSDPNRLTSEIQSSTDDLRSQCQRGSPAAKSKCAALCMPSHRDAEPDEDDGDDDDDDDDDDGRLPHSRVVCDAGATTPAPTPTPTSPTPAPTPTTTTPPPQPTTCTSFTYSAWSACQPNGTQTRTVASSSPAGCTGGSPVTSQSCTYIDGAALYTQYCSGCHGTRKKGSTASSTQSAIDKNSGGMGSLSFLTPEQLAAIAAAP